LCSREVRRTWHVKRARVRRGTTRRYKVTLVGLGAMGLRHARVLRDLEDRFEVVGAYDVKGDAETPPGVERLRCEAEALARAEVVVVAAPTETHAGIVARALGASRQVLVEKPVCATAAEALAVAAMSRPGARLFVGHSERFNPVVRALAKLVRADEIVSIDLRRVGPSRPRASGVLVNLGVHDFDLAAYLGGGDVVLRGALGFGASAAPGDEAAHVLFSTARGAAGHLYVDRGAVVKHRALELTTARWVYKGDLLTHRLVRTSRSGAMPTDVPVPFEEPLVAQARALADALDGGTVREIALGVDGVRALEVAERASALCADAVRAENLSRDARR
jgi:UDP-N-acetylglucosamine 3-dehydrogenase